MKKHTLALLALAFTGSVMAQNANTITNATGVVTATDPSGKGLKTVKIGDTLKDGSTLSTTGVVTVSVNGGACTATLSSGQSITVSTAACQAFVAQQAAAGGSGAAAGGLVAGGAGGLSAATIAGLVAAAIAAGFVIDDATSGSNNTPPSTNPPAQPPTTTPVVTAPTPKPPAKPISNS